MKTLIYCLITLSLLTFTQGYADTPTNTNNDPQLYQVELIIFTHITEKSNRAELTSNQIRWPNIQNSQTLINPPEIINAQDIYPYTLLPQTKMKLNRNTDILSNHDQYQVLMHLAWVEPITNQPERVQIQNNNDQQTDNSSPNRPWEISGLLTLSKNKYITVKTNLVLSLPSSELISNSGFQQDPYAYFQLNQTRRIRSKELNYFDHPAFGMLLQITPISLPPRPHHNINCRLGRAKRTPTKYTSISIRRQKQNVGCG